MKRRRFKDEKTEETPPTIRRRGWKPVNELLGRLIEIANLAPPGFELPFLNDAPDTVKLARKFGDENAEERWFLKVVKSYPKALRDFILTGNGGHPFGAHKYDYEDRRYFIVRETRDKLLHLIGYYRQYTEQQKSSSFHWNVTSEHEGIQGVFGEESIITFTKDPFIEALEGVEARRIRECQKCKRIFWAGRLDMTCCTTKCAKVLRTRHWRVGVSREAKKQYQVARALRESKKVRESKKLNNKG